MLPSFVLNVSFVQSFKKSFRGFRISIGDLPFDGVFSSEMSLKPKASKDYDDQTCEGTKGLDQIVWLHKDLL